jgi:hypothetical protein
MSVPLAGQWRFPFLLLHRRHFMSRRVPRFPIAPKRYHHEVELACLKFRCRTQSCFPSICGAVGTEGVQKGYTVVVAKRIFTLAEARKILPLVRKLVTVAMKLSGEISRYKEAVQELAKGADLNKGSAEGTAYMERLLQLQSCVAQLQGMGCHVKSVEQGLIDFPHLKEGREVYLCWKHDEEDICYWHEIDAGFAGRKRIPED